jgi:hypothetical protein
MDFESIVRISAFGHHQSGKTGQNRPAVFHFSLLFVAAAAPPSLPPLPLAVHRSHPSSLKALSACMKRLQCQEFFAKNQRKIPHFDLKNPIFGDIWASEILYQAPAPPHGQKAHFRPISRFFFGSPARFRCSWPRITQI